MKFGLYIHIPFCDNKCHYCDFSTIKNSIKRQEEYIDLLLREMQQYKGQEIMIDTIYIGGGTPGLLDERLLAKLMHEMKQTFKVQLKECTIEFNPTNYKNIMLIRKLKDLGFNRVSVGVQSFSNKILNYIGRDHTISDVYNCIDQLKKHHIKNYSIDLIYGMENQSILDIMNDLQHIKELKPTHVSWYNLIIEPNTKLYQNYRNGLVGVNEYKEVEIYNFLVSELKHLGYKQYEISNFALEEKYSDHNLKYWKNHNYIGLGVAASSYMYGERTTNPYLYGDYKNKILYGKNKAVVKDFITKKILAFEFIIMRMRLKEGLSLKEFEMLFGIPLEKNNKSLFTHEMKKRNIAIKDGYLHFTTKGFLLSNYFFKNINLNA